MRPLLVLLAFACACQSGEGDRRATDPATDPTMDRGIEKPALPPGAVRLDLERAAAAQQGWWSEPAPCPEGASLHGEPPPAGREVWCALPDGRRHGRAAKWNKLGLLLAEGEHRAGTKHGTFVYYYPDGARRMRVRFENDRENGPVTTWHPGGQKALEGTYRDGKGSGPWTRWDERGNEIASGTYD